MNYYLLNTAEFMERGSDFTFFKVLSIIVKVQDFSLSFCNSNLSLWILSKFK